MISADDLKCNLQLGVGLGIFQGQKYEVPYIVQAPP
jgi:hypothetical protein